ncbi:MAG: DUF6090 family protein [Robiginitalea sp.]
MLRFFRQIRQRLLTDNNFSRYMLYAFGEILLVVIGILIALQIDTWNENRKDSRTEKKHLEEILVSMKRDLNRTRGIYNGRAVPKKQALQDLLNYLNADTVVADSILYPTFFRAGISLSFTYDKGAYESLKAYGLDKISNDSLRPDLVRFYEVSLPLYIIFIDEEREVYKARQASLREKLRSFSYFKEEDGNWTLDMEIDFKSLKEKEAFKELMYLEWDVARNYVRRLENLIGRFEDIIALVESEVNTP